MGAAGEAKGFLPDSKKILWATKLLLPGQSEKLSFTAPAEVGEYPFLCTFPGHWLVMNGVMEVVKDKSTVAVQEVATQVEATQRPFVKMWEMKDLEADAAQPAQGRSLARGKEMFNATGCNKCHLIRDEGGKIGPDLTDVTKKYKGKELLRQMLEPSSEINEQYRTFLIATKEGKRISGMVVKEDAQGIDILSNPLAPAELTRVATSEIQNKKPLTTSSMPTGLLVTLSKDEILDLLAYLESGGAVK